MTPTPPTTNQEQDAVVLGRKQILLARAAELAQVVPASVEDAETVQLLEFSLGRERYALPTDWVQEVCLVTDLTPLPCTPPFVAGIINVRGQVLPVFDLRSLFDLPGPECGNRPRVIRVCGAGQELGILADAVAGVRVFRRADIQPVPLTLTCRRDRYLLGLTDGCLAVLNLARMLADQELIVDEAVPA